MGDFTNRRRRENAPLADEGEKAIEREGASRVLHLIKIRAHPKGKRTEGRWRAPFRRANRMREVVYARIARAPCGVNEAGWMEQGRPYDIYGKRYVYGW